MTPYTLTLSNFQRLSKVELTLEGFTVIRGESNLGKSSIRRAIDSLLFGGFSTPKPKEGKLGYVKRGAKESLIKLEYKDNTVQLTRGTNKNEYKLNGIVLPKGGRGTPPLIKDLGLGEANLHVAGQYEPLFLVGESSQEVTKKINKLTDSDLFEVANSLIRQKLRKLDTIDTILTQEAITLKQTTTKLTHILSILETKESLENKKSLLLKHLLLLEQHTATSLTLKTISNIRAKKIQLLLIERCIKLRDKKSSLTNAHLLILKLISNLTKHSYIKDYLEIDRDKRILTSLILLTESYRANLEGFKHIALYLELGEQLRGLKMEAKDVKRSRLEINKKLEKYTCNTCNTVKGTGVINT